ncbi:peptide methionine sulfoxide reductase MsrA (plasmid) [Phaeobacter gallaeciensis]|uniref:peptide-methionine (S)-S-oxide reductase n=1 Tax=Phaeobacter gallaeciensis TaxID=60890 RepID=A0AAC9ZCL8_9RHOB|nr:peptide-methionine (S)-S-oxide reductase [Phaeobacter gallaeciensis]ATF04045.1 peptide methionine sulfoxide reductase MsrA [Phaeobacter gallaeciensis]ATF08321.1 peptide methionine sulfoxide reductase MsrA [Phaeobacter gallaeciensis]
MSSAKIGLGGGCHWCTEAVFQSLRGVGSVEQGFIKSDPPHDTFSEAVIVTFDPDIIPLVVLIEVHLRTHASTSAHKMRGKYRSAVYTFSDAQAETVRNSIIAFQAGIDNALVTMTLPFKAFKASDERFQDYYNSNTEKPFCKTYIDPKLSKIRTKFADYVGSQDTAESAE